VFRRACGDLLACVLSLHARLRVHWTPGIPCALDLPRDHVSARPGRDCAAGSRLDAKRRSNQMLVRMSEGGWGTWIRTKTNRVRVCCATVTPFPNGIPNKFNNLWNCPDRAATCVAQIGAGPWLRPSILYLPALASAVEADFAGLEAGCFPPSPPLSHLATARTPGMVDIAARPHLVRLLREIASSAYWGGNCARAFFDKLPSNVRSRARAGSLARSGVACHADAPRKKKGRSNGACARLLAAARRFLRRLS
jgi:hypothetical protein